MPFLPSGPLLQQRKLRGHLPLRNCDVRYLGRVRAVSDDQLEGRKVPWNGEEGPRKRQQLPCLPSGLRSGHLLQLERGDLPTLQRRLHQLQLEGRVQKVQEGRLPLQKEVR